MIGRDEFVEAWKRLPKDQRIVLSFLRQEMETLRKVADDAIHTTHLPQEISRLQEGINHLDGRINELKVSIGDLYSRWATVEPKQKEIITKYNKILAEWDIILPEIKKSFDALKDQLLKNQGKPIIKLGS